jgi:hypothetical protein
VKRAGRYVLHSSGNVLDAALFARLDFWDARSEGAVGLFAGISSRTIMRIVCVSDRRISLAPMSPTLNMPLKAGVN